MGIHSLLLASFPEKFHQRNHNSAISYKVLVSSIVQELVTKQCAKIITNMFVAHFQLLQILKANCVDLKHLDQFLHKVKFIFLHY